jgi:hypothetical protein
MASLLIATTQNIHNTNVGWQDCGEMLWDYEGVIHVDFFPHYVTISAQLYSNLLCSTK